MITKISSPKILINAAFEVELLEKVNIWKQSHQVQELKRSEFC